MFKQPQVRAVVVVCISLVVGALVNLATSGFNLGHLRWWLVVAVVLAGGIWATLEYLGARPARHRLPAGRRWLLPPLEHPIERTALLDELVRILTEGTGEVVGLTTGLYGAGGFGKTTLAIQACGLSEVRAHFPGGLLWATIGMERKDAELAAIANDLSAQITGERPQFSDPEQAGRYLGQLLDSRPACLIVIDDVWSTEQLRPFTLGGARATRLVTTRNPAVLPAHAKTIKVDEMEGAESYALITRGLSGIPAGTVNRLLELTGNWPLLLAIVNSAIQGYVRDGMSAPDAAKQIARQLAEAGPAILDVRMEERRDHAVRLTIAASLRLLSPLARSRYLRLGIFPEDTEIELPILDLLWGTDPTATRQLCEDLADLSLVRAYRRTSNVIQLHDVIRDHLRHEISTEIPAINGSLLNAARAGLPQTAAGWWHLPSEHEYLWRHLSYHLAEARRDNELSELVCDLRWGEEKIRRFGLAAYEIDLARVNSPIVDVLRRTLARKGHLLGPIEPIHSHADLLISRLEEVPELQPMVAAYAATLRRDVARLTNRWPIPPVDPALIRVIGGHSDVLTHCDFTPDGMWLATSSGDHTVRIWDTRIWSERAVLSNHTDAVNDCHFSARGPWLATSGGDQTTRIWNSTTWHEQKVLSGHAGAVTGCRFSPSQDLLVTVGIDHTIRLWSTRTWSEERTLHGHVDAITSCRFSPDGTWLATTSADGTVRIWETGRWTEHAMLQGHGGGVLGAAFSPNGRFLASCGTDRAVHVWDTRTWGKHATLKGHTDTVTSCLFAPDQTWLATTSADRTIRVWNTATWTEQTLLRGHTNVITSCACTPDGTWFVTTGADHNIRVWDAVTRHERGVAYHQNRSVQSCAIEPRGQWIMTVGGDNIAAIWEVERPIERVTLHGHTKPLTGCAIAPDGTWVATTSADGTLRIWETMRWRAVAVLHQHEAAVTSCSIDPTGAYLATTSADQSIRIWDTHDWIECHSLENHRDGVISCAFSPDGTLLCATLADSTVEIWDTTAWRLATVLSAHTGPVYTCAFGPDGLLATAGADGTARIWSTTTWDTVAILDGHGGVVTGSAFARSGRWLATTAGDVTLRIWETGTWKLSAAMRTNGWPNAVAWFPDGQRVTVGGVGGTYQFNFISPVDEPR